MEIESAASEKPTSDNSDGLSVDVASISAAASSSSGQPSVTSYEITIQASVCAAITEDHLTVKRDFPVFTTATTSLQHPLAISAKVHAHGGEADGDDARSTSSSHPFSSPNPSEQDDIHGGADSSVTHSESRKLHRRRKNEASAGSAFTGSSVMPGNRQPFPLSERQQLALAMQLSAQNQLGDHPKSPSASISTTPSSSGGRARGKLAKVHRKNERGETPLHLAAKRGEFQRCQELIDDGADVNCVDYADWTPLHEACNQGWYKTAKVLVEHGANVNVFGLDDDTPLHDAALSGHRKLVILLLQHGADPHKYNKHGKRPLDVAEDPEVIRLMMEGTPKCSSPFSNYSVESPANEENETARTPQVTNSLDKTLTADEVGMDTSAVNTSVFTISEVSDTSASKEDALGANSAVSPLARESFVSAEKMMSEPDNSQESSSIEPAAAGISTLDISSNAAYASTESENEQRLVVVEDESFGPERPLSTVVESPTPEETSSSKLQHVSHSEPVLSSTNSTKAADELRVVRPKRHIAYIGHRRLEPEVSATASACSSPATAGVRGRKRKTLAGGPRATDVYEFHSSDSDDEAETVEASGKLRKKFAKVGTGARQATSAVTSSALSTTAPSGAVDVTAQKEKAVEAETRAMVEKIKMEVERKEEEREKNAVAAVVDAVSVIPADPATKSKTETTSASAATGQDATVLSSPPLKSDAKCSKDDIQVVEAAKQAAKESQEDLRGRSLSHTMVTMAAASSDKVADMANAAASTSATAGGTGSRKERLLGFGRHRVGFGQMDQKSQRERDAHIENVVASIGSGVGTSSTIGATQDPAATSALLNEAAHGMKKKLLLELSRGEIRQETASAVSEHQKPKARTGSLEPSTTNEEEDSAASGLKVPPLKLILAGRSNSEEDNSYNPSNSRESSGRTYVVRSRANSPSSERRGSTAADLADNALATSSAAVSSKVEEARRIGTVNNHLNASVASVAANAGNGGGEASQRVTRSQVRLHGAQLDRGVDDPMATAIHPRKRKLRSAKAMIEPIAVNRPLLPVVSPSLAAIAVKHSYEAHQHMKKAIANKWKQEMDNNARAAAVNPVKGYDQFLLKTKTYLTERKDGEEERPLDDVTKSTLPLELIELNRQQTEERHRMGKRHQMERERLIISCESEAIRDHNRCVRGTADPAMSVMRVLRDSDLYNPLQLDKDVPFSLAASAAQDFSVAVTDVTSRFARSKRQLVGRQRLEAQCLHATQVQEWERKFKGLLLQTSDTASSAAVNVPQLTIVEDFPLLPSAL